jgi:hypothetical protein
MIVSNLVSLFLSFYLHHVLLDSLLPRHRFWDEVQTDLFGNQRSFGFPVKRRLIPEFDSAIFAVDWLIKI